MPDKPVLHGRDHSPGGMDASQPGQWIYVSDSSASAWNSGTNYVKGDTVGDGTYNYVCVLANGPTTYGPSTTDLSGNYVGAFNPGVSPTWPTYWAISEPMFLNGWDNQGGDLQTMRFRISLGNYNQLDRSSGNVSTHSDHQLEIQGSVTGGSDLTVIFALPPAYFPQAHLHLAACDDVGAFVSFTVQSTGNVIKGFV